jgi:FkbM family methyltransferase
MKRLFKRNTHNLFFKLISSAGRSINRLYENRNHDIRSNGEEWLIKKIKAVNPTVFFDVGANTGKYCKEIKKHHPQAQAFCFEPVQSTFEILKKEIASYENVIPINAGLYHEPKTITINIYPSHTHASLYDLKGVSQKVVRKEAIQLVRGDDIIAEHQVKFIDVLKLDVEGAELDALSGLKQALFGKKIRLIQFEYGYINITTKNLLADYYEFFNQFGYSVGKLYPKKVEFRPYQFKHEDFIGPNMIAIRSDDAELKKILS